MKRRSANRLFASNGSAAVRSRWMGPLVRLVRQSTTVPYDSSRSPGENRLAWVATNSDIRALLVLVSSLLLGLSL